jgi:hypothetical protein
MAGPESGLVSKPTVPFGQSPWEWEAIVAIANDVFAKPAQIR